MKLLKWLDEYMEKYFLIATLIAMVVIITMQVVFRMFGRSLVWAEELTRYIMLYQIWVGAAYAVKENAHLRITFLRDKLSHDNRFRLEVFVTTIWIFFSLWLTIKSASLTNILFSRNQLSSAMQIPMGYAYASVPIGCALMTYRLIQSCYKQLLELKEGGE